ncbi:hypothetical protein ABT061_40525 [Streptosporangium sp. NPDC002544]|uniref:hypothetical protein n=1 Tax=Streptosporangium sp. NPDC002544 TaxID=3154538 RepID=UPI0033303E79
MRRTIDARLHEQALAHLKAPPEPLTLNSRPRTSSSGCGTGRANTPPDNDAKLWGTTGPHLDIEGVPDPEHVPWIDPTHPA